MGGEIVGNVIDNYKISKIINYNRKSRQDIEREKKTGEDTLAEIIKLMTGVLDKYGVPYVQRNEIGSGDKIETRPVFQEVLKELQNGEYDAIAVKEISRLGRGSYTDMGKIYDLLIEKRIYVITPWKIYDPQNNSDLRQIRFELFLSREEFETTRERLIGGRYSGAMQGRWVAGQAPFGYKYNDSTQKLDPHEEEEKIVKMIFDFYVNGVEVEGTKKEVSFRAIATHLKRLQVNTPSGENKEWRAIQVKRVIENPVYNGEVHFRKKVRKGSKYDDRPSDEHIIVKDAHEPLVDGETWEKAQDKLNNKERKLPNSKLDFSPCELAGLVVCKVCGRKMVRQYSVQHYTKADGETSIYHKEFLWCTTSACSFVKYRDVEAGLLEFLGTLKDLNEKDLAERLTKLVKVKAPTEEILNIAEHVEQKKKELESRMKFIYEKLESGVYTDEMFLERKAVIEKEKAELDKIKIDKKEEIKKEDIDIDKVRNNIDTYLSAYAQLENKTRKNKILTSVFDEITLEIIEKGRGRKSAIFRITPILRDSLLV